MFSASETIREEPVSCQFILQHHRPLSTKGTTANDISYAGQIVGDYLEFGIDGFFYSSGTYTALNDPLPSAV